MRSVFYTCLALLVLALLHCTLPLVSASSELDSEVGDLVERAGDLYSKGLDVSVIIEKLNSAVVLSEEGSVEEARGVLSEVRSLVEDMSTVADSVYFTNTLIKGVTVAVLAAIPVLVYTLLPRVYLYLWFKSRKKWLVLRW